MSYTSRKSVSVRRDTASGFTLIELAIVMVIAGFFMVGLVKAYELYLVEQRRQEMDNKMDEMRRALASYIKDKQCVDNNGDPQDESFCRSSGDPQLRALGNETTGTGRDPALDAVRYPCPADPTLAPDNADYAREDCSLPVTNGVMRGAFPAATLDLPTEVMIDPYGNKYSYAVTADATQVGALSNNANTSGDVTVLDHDGNPLTNKGMFALFSHGRDAAQAYTRQGVQIAGTPSGKDQMNAPGTAPGTFRYSEGQYRASGSEYFDDTVAYSLVDDKDDEWWFSDDGGTTITHRNPGDVIMGNKPNSNVGIGTNNPQNKVQIGDFATPDHTVSGYKQALSFKYKDGNPAGSGAPKANLEPHHGYINVDALNNNGDEVGIHLRMDGDGDTDNDGLLKDGADDAAIWLESIDGNNLTPLENEFTLWTDGSAFFDGNVGVGTKTPQTKLDVEGEVKLDNNGLSSGCPASKEGAQRYNPTYKAMEYCDGSRWRTILAADEEMVHVEVGYGLGGDRTDYAEVQCPSDSIRVGCTGSRHPDLNDTGDEGDRGIIGTRPIDPNGCQVSIDATSGERATVWAVCLSPNGGGSVPSGSGTPSGSSDGGGTLKLDCYETTSSSYNTSPDSACSGDYVRTSLSDFDSTWDNQSHKHCCRIVQ